MADLCAACHTPLTTLPNGSRLRCCGKGYWSRRAPEPRDRWGLVPYKTQGNGWFLYVRWEL
jgi:hypothetical protein